MPLAVRGEKTSRANATAIGVLAPNTNARVSATLLASTTFIVLNVLIDVREECTTPAILACRGTSV